MLYPTPHRPLLSPFYPFTSSSISMSFSPSSTKVVEMGLESVEGALKSSLRPDMELKVSQNCVHFQQPAAEDLWSGYGQQGDDFSVDDLLDFSNDLVQPLDEEEQKTEPEKELQPPKLQHQNKVCTTQSCQNPTDNSCITDDFASLSVPVDDLESLEWLSHFVEDSFCEYSLTCPPGKPHTVVKKEHLRSEPVVELNESTVFTTPVQTKARTKRSRSGLRVWSLGAASLTEHSSTSSSSSTSSMTASENGNNSPWSAYRTAESIEPAGLKRRKMMGKGLCETPQPRRCSHCGVQKTPQWRAGPLGAKTLCNACGVRFKSGRLLPEYRPACSPTFSSELHSNNHRKVLEMRRKKDGETELASPV